MICLPQTCHTSLKKSVCALLSLSLFIAVSADAALKPSTSNNTAAISPQQASNPKADPSDIVLSMPGGFSMVFRAVAIPARGVLYDKKFMTGLPNTENDRSIYERRMESYISAPFRQADLPTNWIKQLPQDEQNGYLYYFIGKYEITNGQWKAVMGDEGTTGADNLPKTNISWYDLQDFLKKYNQWLLKEHADELPNLEGMPGYLRLPSEAEWEFAARGGNLPPEQANFNEFYLDKDKTIKDYAVFGMQYDKPMPIASKTASNLGLYDMAGNVAEMVQSTFRFTIADSGPNGITRRLHGSEGGLIAKGGSFLSSSESEVLPGKRNELRMFIKDDQGNFVPFSARNVGARLVISSINVPGMKRQHELLAEAGNMSGAGSATSSEQPPSPPTASNSSDAENKPDKLVNLNPNGSPLQELDKVIKAASSPFMQSNLYQLRDILEVNNAALERERDENLTNSVRSAIYKADSIRSLAWRCWYMSETIHDWASKLKPAELKEFRNRFISYYKLLETSTNFYRNSVQDLAQVPEEQIKSKIIQMQKEYDGKDLIHQNMRKNILVLNNHTMFSRKQGIDELSTKQVWRDLIAPQMLEQIENEFNNDSTNVPRKKKNTKKG